MRTAAPADCGACRTWARRSPPCRIAAEDVDGIYAELAATGVLHPVSRDGVTVTDFGTRELATLDRDGNLITFFRWVS